MQDIALITGACGGMGRAASHVFGQAHALFVTDIKAGRLEALVAELKDDGFTVAGSFAGDLAEDATAKRVAADARAAGRLTAVFHAAGLSPALAHAGEILRVNVTATELLLRALEAELAEGLTAILIASMAAYFSAYPNAEIEAACSLPLESGFVERTLGLIEASLPPELVAATAAYSHSKLAVIRMAEKRCAAWARRGARILTISPGLINTPMGRAEIAYNPQVAEFIDATPLGLGTASDVAVMAGFLCSKQARYMTGSDIRLDGGATAVVLTALRAERYSV